MLSSFFINVKFILIFIFTTFLQCGYLRDFNCFALDRFKCYLQKTRKQKAASGRCIAIRHNILPVVAFCVSGKEKR